MVINLVSNEKFIDHLDLFSNNLNIHISGKKKHTTIMGSILGLVSIIGIIIISALLFQNLFERKNKYITYNQDRDVVPVNNLTDTPLMYIIVDNLGRPVVTKGSLNIQIVHMNYMKVKNEKGEFKIIFESENIPYQKCDLNSTFGVYKEIFKDVPFIDDYKCIPPNSKNLTIYGKFGDTKTGFSYINFFIQKCDNKTSNNSCKSEEEINAKFSNVFFVLTFMDNQIDNNNSTKVYKKVYRSNTYSMGPFLHKRYFQYLRQVIYDTDYALIFEENNREIFYQQDNFEVDVKLSIEASQGNSLSNFGQVSLLNANKVDFYFKTYDKIQNIIAVVGGIIKGILITAQIINFIFTRNYSLLQIINSIFDFEDVENLLKEYKFSSKKHFFVSNNSIRPSTPSFLKLNLSESNINNEINPVRLPLRTIKINSNNKVSNFNDIQKNTLNLNKNNHNRRKLNLE